jgi:hypothetical protein
MNIGEILELLDMLMEYRFLILFIVPFYLTFTGTVKLFIFGLKLYQTGKVKPFWKLFLSCIWFLAAGILVEFSIFNFDL